VNFLADKRNSPAGRKAIWEPERFEFMEDGAASVSAADGDRALIAGMRFSISIPQSE